MDIVRDLVIGQYDGHVRVDPRPGEARFIVRLPLDPGERDGG